MLWEKNQKKEVFFTEEAADKQLLAAIEKELNSQKYQTFSNLCKQALWQFLYVSSSTELAQSASNLQRLEHRIYEKLTQHFSELEKKFAASELNESNNISQLNDLKRNLSQINQLLTQMQLNFDDKFLEVLQAFKAELPKIEAGINQLEAGINQLEVPIVKTTQDQELTSTKPTEGEAEANLSAEESITESDPLLQRLGSLIEDF
ncbi:hypothetical protein [Hydrocoleum sp. CS-953]|uniref:hypothetical protein n=1 Tax=Microcoleaceae TaxID=1892252 RepID=UPI000B9B58A7|nr:hypothetical protein [Hydrocoleum sp. CS-953]OZH55093.1 hypothetical protein AFK68_06765 [Hydrocoleum sp. CS-953]